MSKKLKTYLLLKWGTIKAWDFRGNKKLQELMEEYIKDGVSLSCALQKDTPKQKKLICQMIDLVDVIENDVIENDWTGEKMSKKEAKEYVMNYEKNSFKFT